MRVCSDPIPSAMDLSSITAMRTLEGKTVIFEPNIGKAFMDSGKFSDVYAGKLMDKNGTNVVVKVLKTTYFSGKSIKEIRILEQCSDIEGVIKLLGVINEAKESDSLVALCVRMCRKEPQWLSHRRWTSRKKFWVTNEQ